MIMFEDDPPSPTSIDLPPTSIDPDLFSQAASR